MRTTCVTKVGLCVVAATVALAGCVIHLGDTLRCEARRTVELGSAVGGATALSIATNVGTIKLTPGDANEVRVTADITIKAKTDEEAAALLDEVRVTAEPSGKTLVVKAAKPGDLGRNQLTVNLTIKAPTRLRLVCRTNVGDVQTNGFAGPVEARTNVGKITCAGLRDRVDLHTNVGDIRADYAPDAPAAVEVTAGTDVGSIRFAGPKDISANLNASSNVGSIHTSRPLIVTGTVGKSVKASLGDGEGRIDLHTNVGSIHIE
jgi:hypothetical protein